MNNTIKDTFIGMLLGDGHIKRSGLKKAIITYNQSTKKIDYFNYVHNLLQNEGLVNIKIKTYKYFDFRYCKIYESIHLTTKAMEILKPLAEMFLDEKGKKKIPFNIGEHLTYRSLAH